MTRGKKSSAAKLQAIEDFRDHVSSGKAAFFQKYGMQFIMGSRDGCYLGDVDGRKRLFNLHCNGGVFNLGHRNPELIPDVIRCINRHLPPDQQPLSMEEVKKYYKEDKLIWTLFLAFRRIDRWMTTKLFRGRYEFLLPGRIER